MSAYKDKKTGKWCAHVRYTDWQGEARRKLKRGFKTKREALAWERGFLVSVNAFLANSTNEPAPIAPSKRRRFRQRKPAASG